MDAWLSKTNSVHTTQNDVNNRPASYNIDNMDIDTTSKQPATIPISPSKQPATVHKSPIKQRPPLQDCYVSVSCPATAPTPQQSNKPKCDTTTTDIKPTLIPAAVSHPIASNPAVAAVADDQPAKQSPKKRKLTPEEKQAREDVKKAKDEERRIQLQLKEEAKNKKEEERKALALAKEEEKKKKDEEKRIKDQAKEDARLKKEAEKKARDDAKLQKDTERKEKEEARLQMLQEKQKQEEEEKQKKLRVQERQQAVLAKFVKVTTVEAPQQKVDPNLLIQPYVRGSDTTFPKDYLAKREPSPAFEDAMSHKGDFTTEVLRAEFKTYMHGRRNRKKKRREERLQGLPPTLSNMKLLRFHENVRPSYYGTFSKRSSVLTGRRPLRTDEKMFDYDVDSDAEWEDEGEGEALSESEGEKEKDEEESEEEEEDKWVVPDGYLSEDEGMDSDDEKSKRAVKKEEGEGGDADTASSSTSTKRPAENMEREKTKREKREKKACIISTTFDPESLDNSARAILASLSIQPLVDCPIDLDWRAPTESEDQGVSDARSSKQMVPESLMPALILFIHSHPSSLQKIVEGFHSENTQVSKRQLELKIREIAIKTNKSATCKATSWQVRDEVVKSFSVTLPEIVEVKAALPKTPQKNVTDFFFKTPAKTPIKTPAKTLPPNPSPTRAPLPSSPSSSSSSSSASSSASAPPPAENGCHNTPKRNLMDMFQKHQKTHG